MPVHSMVILDPHSITPPHPQKGEKQKKKKKKKKRMTRKKPFSNTCSIHSLMLYKSAVLPTTPLG